jgi:hypothetical protein
MLPAGDLTQLPRVHLLVDGRNLDETMAYWLAAALFNELSMVLQPRVTAWMFGSFPRCHLAAYCPCNQVMQSGESLRLHH